MSATDSARASDPITFVVHGEITDLFGGGGPAPPGFFQVGDEFRIVYTFDPLTPDSDPTGEFGRYVGAVTSMEVTIGSHGGSGLASGEIQVCNGFNGVDCYIVTSGLISFDLGDNLDLRRVFIGVNDVSATAWDTDAIPLVPPDIAKLPDVNGVSFDINAPGMTGGGLTGEVRSFHLPSVDVEVDIKPGDAGNRVGTMARLWVAVLSSSEFNPSEVNVDSLGFGPSLASPLRVRHRDVNGDGIGDHLALFSLSQSGFTTNDSQGCVFGETSAGVMFQGCDSISIVGND